MTNKIRGNWCYSMKTVTILIFPIFLCVKHFVYLPHKLVYKLLNYSSSPPSFFVTLQVRILSSVAFFILQRPGEFLLSFPAFSTDVS